ncbi:MAG: outer membrane protein assembly factor BamA, partial [Deltaproteobacteria bacterium]|nr:outer membrane protein assembly factor BamA [Deltaproteobacteria bacterium]
VGIQGDLIGSEEELLRKLKITQKEFYSRETVRNDLLTLTDLYSDHGYAYADIYPRIQKKDDTLEVNLEYVVKQGKKVYFESIIISGNNKSRDKVIRRELKVYEQELYSGKALKRSIRNLYRLDFFEDVKVDTVEGGKDDEITLKIDVVEKPTGNFMFGGGYSSVDYGYVMASVSQNNLFGRGQKLQLRATLSEKSRNYTLSFTEPYLFDTNISAGFDIYDQEKEFDDYDKDSQGGRVRLGYKLIDYTRLFWAYTYDISEVSDIDDDASDDIKDIDENFDGDLITSATKVTLRYDSRDRVFNPTEGSLDSISVEYAGLGGDVGFTKYEARSGWFFPLFWGTVGMLHAKGGYIHENGAGEILPDYERFYLGGMHSVRGFDWRDISTVDSDGDEIGGERFVQFNVEWVIPLLKDAGVMGVLFFDAGNVFGEDDELDMDDPTREGGGAGIRWYSPLGPLRLEYGWILDPREDEDTEGRWEFSVGSLF